MNEPVQAVMWDRSHRDETPLETGGAVLVVRLTPNESDYLLTLAGTLHEAVHELLRRSETKE